MQSQRFHEPGLRATGTRHAALAPTPLYHRTRLPKAELTSGGRAVERVHGKSGETNLPTAYELGAETVVYRVFDRVSTTDTEVESPLVT